MKFIILIFIQLYSFTAYTANFELVWKNKKGNDYIKSWFKEFEQEMEKVKKGEIKQEDFKKPDTLPVVKAYSEYLQALAIDSFDPLLHINLGVSLELLDKNKEAQKEYSIAIKYSREFSQQRLYAMLNIARMFGKLKKIDKAIEYYQKALDLNEEVLKIKDVSFQIKTNIELLFKSGKGKGKGDGKNNKNPKKDKKKGNKNKKKKPQKFKSKKLSKEDVRRILNELKKQEQKIRKKINRRKTKEMPRDKQW